ncbi:hypothetical protein B0J14DRAFT_700116 [Halenospora varia]|nr:hypothetical protein B0J14DRAFT_700116 [Halenospora varia]
MEDFNLPSLERIALLERLQETIGDVPPYFWAACQVCDLKALEKLVEVACISPAIVHALAGQTYTMIYYWTQSTKGLSPNATPKITPKKLLGSGSSPTGSPPAKRQKTTDSPGSIEASLPLLRRSQVAADLARERDGGCCVLTSTSVTDVAHIYPFCRLKDSEENIFGARHTFWIHLKNFWPKEKVTAWEAELFPKGLSESGDERVDNLITLSKVAHGQWNRGAFALKPISVCNNNTTLKVQFFWQKKQNDTRAAMSLLTTPLSTEDLDCNEGAFDYGDTILHYHETRIKSGQIFELKTDDPIKKPLPSFKLLELQWFLMRVIGMAGAAFPYKVGWGDDEDDEEEVPYLRLDEVGDISFTSDLDLPSSPEFLRKANRLPREGSKHHMEEAEGDRQSRSNYTI